MGDQPVDEEDEGGLPVYMKRIMSTQMMYMGGQTPEKQFVGELVKRKEAALEAGRERARSLYKRDFILDFDLARPDPGHAMRPRVWRRLRVSGGTPLAALADKVLTPAMGWVRNYHGHLYTDFRDGALLGDPESGSIDMMHQHHYFAFLDERKWRLADLLQEPGQQVGWRYDLGDNWRHVITCVEVVPEGESTGRVAVLDGSCACPPEDSKGLEGMGCASYQDCLELLPQPGYKSSAAYRTVVREASASLNYQQERAGFDPSRFVLSEAQRRVEAALGSRASVTSGAKQFVTHLQPGLAGLWGDRSGPGQEVRRDPAEGACPDCGPYMQETVATSGKDPRGMACCFTCGNPNNLLVCSGCKSVRFCGGECKAEQARRAAAATGSSPSS